MRFHGFTFFMLYISMQALSLAQWQPNGIPVCDTTANSGFYMLPQIASDGNGGAFVCWLDRRRGGYDIYMQRIYPDGSMQFQHNGIILCDAPYSQQFPRMASDGRRGAFIAWEDDRTMTQTYVYVQRINSMGQALWTVNGVRAADIGGLFISLALEPISGGVLLGWSTVESAFVQRLDSLGNRMWGDSGVQVTNRPGDLRAGDVAVTTDGIGGLIVVWAEGISANYRVYAQRIDSAGTTRWATNGVLLSDTSNLAGAVTISSHGNSEVIISWVGNQQTYIQKLNGTGQSQWGTNGVFVGRPGGRHFADGLGGAFVWYGNKVQRFSADGVRLWDSLGIKYTSVPFPTRVVGLRDRTSGIWNFWAQGGASYDIYGQYIDSSGNRQWGLNGMPVCTAVNMQDYPHVASDGSGYAIVVWDDFRNGRSNVYATKVDTRGVVTSAPEDHGFLLPMRPTLDQNYPNPFNPGTTISFSLPRTTFVTLKVYDVLGRELENLIQDILLAGRHQVRFSGNAIPSGVYFYRLTAEQTTIVKKFILMR